MRRHVQPRTRRQVWWCMAVFVLAMLAPGISMALAQARGDISQWQDICSASSSARGKIAEPGGAALKLLTQGHCPACHLSWTDLAGPPAAVAQATLRNDIGYEAPERFWTAPVTGHAWRPARARAPPGLI